MGLTAKEALRELAFRILPGIALTLVLIVIAIPVMAVIAFFGWIWSENLFYAQRVFEHQVEITRVVASKRWLDFNKGFGCTYAVVQFSPESARKLRARGPQKPTYKGSRSRRRLQRRWNVQWQPTPMVPARENYSDSDPLNLCLKELPVEEGGLIAEYLAKPGSWYSRRYNRVAFVSPGARLAAIFNYGD